MATDTDTKDRRGGSMTPIKQVEINLPAVSGITYSNESCRTCGDTGFESVTAGGRSYVKPCMCRSRKSKAGLENSIPLEFRPAILAEEKAFRDDRKRRGHSSQSKVLAALRRNPTGSFAFCGGNGTGKTRFMWCMYRHAVESGRRAVILPLRDLLNQYRQSEISKKSGDQVKVAVWPIQIADGNWTVCLDEIEKSRPSEFAAETFFALVRAILDHRQQLIVTSNFTLDELADHWGRADSAYGTSIVRRIDDLCTTIEMF